MSKLRLDLDDLKVESFETGSDEQLSGTIFGYSQTPTNYMLSDPTIGTCISCYGGCGPSGGPTCDPDPDTCDWKKE